MPNNVPLDHWGRGPGGKPRTSAGARVTQPAKAVQRPTLRHEKPAPQQSLSASTAPVRHTKPQIAGRDAPAKITPHTKPTNAPPRAPINTEPHRTQAPVFQPQEPPEGARRTAYPGKPARHSRPGDAASRLYPNQGAR